VVVFTAVAGVAEDPPKWEVLDTKKFDYTGSSKTSTEILAEVTPIVKDAVTAKIRSLMGLAAGDADPNITFSFENGSSFPSPYDKLDTRGQSFFVIGTVIDATSTVGAGGVVTKVDFSKTKIVGLPYYVVTTNVTDQRKIMFKKAGDDRVYTDPGPEDTFEHEFWHTDGISVGLQDRMGTHHIVPDGELRNGFRGGIFQAKTDLRNYLSKARKTGELLPLDTNDKAKAYIAGKVSEFVTSAGALQKIVDHGSWYGGVAIVDGEEMYPYGGKWKWVGN
jgi:hypothetical protein